MAFPRMTKLIDLTRSVLDPRGDDIRADRIVPSGITDKADVFAQSTRPDTVQPAAEGSILSDTPPEDLLSVAPGDLPDIFPDTFYEGFENGDADLAGDTFSFGEAVGTPPASQPAAGAATAATLTADSSQIVPAPIDNGFDFGPLANDHAIDFSSLDSATPATVTANATPVAGAEIGDNNGGIPVHAVGCACTDCCAEGDGDGHNHPQAYASDGGDEPTPVDGGPTSGFSVSTISTTGNNAIDSLLQTYRWGSGSATVDMTFSFGTSSSVYLSGYSEPSNGFGEFSEHQKTATRSALDYWSNVANITFTEVTDSASVAGDLRFAKSSDPSTAWAYLPSSSAKGGDVWVGPSSY